MKITKLTLIDGENLREMNLVFPPHVAVYGETVGGDVGGVRSLFTQVLWTETTGVGQQVNPDQIKPKYPNKL